MKPQGSHFYRRTAWAGLVLAALSGTVAGLGSYAFYFAHGASYLSDDPRACVNCHIMREEFDAWLKGGHHAHATCNDCHVPQSLIPRYLVKIEHGYRHSKGFTFQDFHEPILIKSSSREVVQDNCLRCHGALTSEIAGHAGDDRSLGCTHCHQQTGHRTMK